MSPKIAACATGIDGVLADRRLDNDAHLHLGPGRGLAVRDRTVCLGIEDSNSQMSF
jgi:hypothetical protein